MLRYVMLFYVMLCSVMVCYVPQPYGLPDDTPMKDSCSYTSKQTILVSK